MRVFLVGFMGAGKTTVGRLLARHLGLPFVDLDQEIEAAAGCLIPELFSEEGEARFRDREHDALREAVQLPAAVVATGGGLPAFERNRELMRASGRQVWLDVPFELLSQRLGPSPGAARPLFRDRATARALFEQRRDFYRQADHRLPVAAGDTPQTVTERILGLLGGASCAS